MGSLIECEDVWKIYRVGDVEVQALRGLSLTIKQGEFVCLIGHSGCGKSTVLSMVAGLSEVSSGGIILAGKELTGPGPDRGIVFQSPCLLPWMSAFKNVMLGVDQVFYTAGKDEREQIAEYYLSVVGLADAMHKFPAELSQGMRQRVGIARAFALAPRMLLLDEPFGMLDALTRWDLQEVLMDILKRTKITAICVTHDVDEAILVADRVIMMTNGPRARIGKVMQVDLPRPRTRKMLLEHPRYYVYREELLTFLNDCEHGGGYRAA